MTRTEAIALGRCGTCRRSESKPVPGCVNCQSCLDAAKLGRKWARHLAAEHGLCGECLKNDARPGKRSCQLCACKRKTHRDNLLTLIGLGPNAF